MSTLSITNPALVDEAVQRFREQAAATTSSYELAVLERDLWKRVRGYILGPSRTFKHTWWVTVLGQRSAAFYRAALLSRGDRVKALWSYIDYICPPPWYPCMYLKKRAATVHLAWEQV